MSSIKISELKPTGLELFQDYESFLNELTTQEIERLKGGVDPVINYVYVNSTQVVQSQGELSEEQKQALQGVLGQALDVITEIF